MWGSLEGRAWWVVMKQGCGNDVGTKVSSRRVLRMSPAFLCLLETVEQHNDRYHGQIPLSSRELVSSENEVRVATTESGHETNRELSSPASR